MAGLTGFLAIIGFCLLMVFGLQYYQDWRKTNGEGEFAQESTTTSFYESLFGFMTDDENDGSGSSTCNSAYFSSIFADFEFIFRVKNYKALEDDNLAEMDHLVH